MGRHRESLRFEGKRDYQTKAMIALFELFAEVERALISERTKTGLSDPMYKEVEHHDPEFLPLAGAKGVRMRDQRYF